MDKIQNNQKEILKTYFKKFSKKDLFYHILERIDIHIDKLKKLKEDQKNQDLFQKEVADMYLLSKVLLELENISDETIKKSSDYYLKKIKDLFDK
jgi:hypothetical protein